MLAQLQPTHRYCRYEVPSRLVQHPRVSGQGKVAFGISVVDGRELQTMQLVLILKMAVVGFHKMMGGLYVFRPMMSILLS